MGAVQSVVQKFKTSVIWTIKNVTQMLQNVVPEKFVEFDFTTSPNDEFIKWKCKVFPFGNRSENKNFVSIFLYLDSRGVRVKADVNFTILDAQFGRTRFTEDTGPVDFNNEKNSWGYPQFFATDELLKKSNNIINERDEMNVLCEVTILDCETIQEAVTQIEQNKNQVVDDFTRLLGDYRYSDVMLVADGLQYKAHRAILSARSPVFSAMFDHDMTERNSNRVNIPEMSGKCLKELLLFIYTGECEKLDEMAEELFKAANKYQIEDLRLACLKSLRKNLNRDVVASVVVLADTYGASELKAEAMNLIKENASYVMQTEGWKESLMNYPEIMHEICVMLAEGK